MAVFLQLCLLSITRVNAGVHAHVRRSLALRSMAPGAVTTAFAALDAYSGPQAFHTSPEIFQESILPQDDRLWVPQTDTVSFYPLCLATSQGYYANVLRVKGGGGLLSCHRHTGPVHAHVLQGRWRYLEHEWVAEAGSYVYETPGETHTLVTVGEEDMITLFHVTGALMYCDERGQVTRAEDVFDKVRMAREHYDKVGLGADHVLKFIR